MARILVALDACGLVSRVAFSDPVHPAANGRRPVGSSALRQTLGGRIALMLAPAALFTERTPNGKHQFMRKGDRGLRG
jgi:hypothetical protein